MSVDISISARARAGAGGRVGVLCCAVHLQPACLVVKPNPVIEILETSLLAVQVQLH